MMKKIDLHNYEAFFLDYVEGNLSTLQRAEVEEFLNKHPHLKQELKNFEMITLPKSPLSGIHWDNLKKPDLNTLKNNIELRNEFFVKAVDGTLMPAEEKVLNELIKIPEFKAEFDVWKKTVLLPPKEEIAKDNLYQFGLNEPISHFNFEYFLIARTEGLLTPAQNTELEIFAATVPQGEDQLKLADRLRLEPPKGIFYPDKKKLYRKKLKPIIWWAYRAAAIILILVSIAVVRSFFNQPVIVKAPVAQQDDKSINEADTTKNKKIVKADTLQSVSKEHIIEEMQGSETPAKKETVLPAQNTVVWVEPMKEKEPKRIEMELTRIESYADYLLPASQPAPAPLKLEFLEMEMPEWQPEEESKFMAALQTIPDFAKGLLRNRFYNPARTDDSAPGEKLRNITREAGQILDIELKKEIEQVDDNELLTYSFRIGSLTFSRSKAK